jgi:Na+-translocating ferredoxin:NAD+ oxidoreductase RNF subunit RnfB
MSIAVIAIISAGLIGAVLGVVIGVVAKVFAVEVDERIEGVEERLPGANCGGCGFAGCADFAKGVVAEKATPDQCPVCSAEDLQNIAEYLGIVAEEKEKVIALIKCGGTNSLAVRAKYNGVADCKSAVLVAAGGKGCSYGCLGMASCARACPFDAIEMRDGLAIVHENLCVGCGKCVDTCPRNLIELVPASAQVHVYCNSPEKGAEKMKVCKAACIGCRKCVKAAEEDQMKVDGFLVSTNYDNPPPAELVEAAGCPTKCLKTGQAHAAPAQEEGA